MIRIERPEQAPKTLREKGPDATRALWATYNADPMGVAEGKKALTIDRDLYGASDVKDALIAMQHGKCAFCESKILHVEFGDVEHFRPKRGWQQAAGDTLQRPGYFWLAYAWENLLLACTVCNRRHKGNLFPLLDPAARATPGAPDVTGEDPLFIDPSAQEDPESLISFVGVDPCPMNGDERARQTIRALALGGVELGDAETRRPHLRERRLVVLQNLKCRVELLLAVAEADTLPPQFLDRVVESLRWILSAVESDAEYAAMSRAYLSACRLREEELFAIAKKL